MLEEKKSAAYTIVGVVKEGHQKGEAVGARTANLDLAAAQNMPQGLYLGEMAWTGGKLPGLLYYGINSLTNEDCLEVHALDFAGELYGETITFITSHYLRPPARFESVEDLAAQVKKDLAEARQLLDK